MEKLQLIISDQTWTAQYQRDSRKVNYYSRDSSFWNEMLRIMMQNIFKVNFSCLAVQLGMEGQEDDNFIEH